MITRFGGAPLIVTLGTYSLFRGIAEGLTRGVDNFSQFPAELPVSRPRLSGRRWFPRRLPVFVLFAAVLLAAAASQHLWARGAGHRLLRRMARAGQAFR